MKPGLYLLSTMGPYFQKLPAWYGSSLEEGEVWGINQSFKSTQLTTLYGMVNIVPFKVSVLSTTDFVHSVGATARESQ